jgi:hypothetical protein
MSARRRPRSPAENTLLFDPKLVKRPPRAFRGPDDRGPGGLVKAKATLRHGVPVSRPDRLALPRTSRRQIVKFERRCSLVLAPMSAVNVSGLDSPLAFTDGDGV